MFPSSPTIFCFFIIYKEFMLTYINFTPSKEDASTPRREPAYPQPTDR